MCNHATGWKSLVYDVKVTPNCCLMWGMIRGAMEVLPDCSQCFYSFIVFTILPTFVNEIR